MPGASAYSGPGRDIGISGCLIEAKPILPFAAQVVWCRLASSQGQRRLVDTRDRDCKGNPFPAFELVGTFEGSTLAWDFGTGPQRFVDTGSSYRRRMTIYLLIWN